ncbi:exodeoxyribonuclease V subunit alpha [Shewanella cyperi]|uniref:RecBCD enzyme subunit RecD n=1 Tax=Shewanella cyperi TaxID=2814292 RepID=A0A975ALU1_9GAMM|nr:exodeoxyribonuclease V subunit alpha [Shewanella cyperi]QSX31560.1 exodeoxyribonuclease V subunit alpha [Shewanella cyperi]
MILTCPIPMAQQLKVWQQQGLLEPLNRHFALELTRLHGDDSPLGLLCCALVSRNLSAQNSCLLLSDLDLQNPLGERQPSVSINTDLPGLLQAIAALPMVAAPGDKITKPLVLDGDRLYLKRYHSYEVSVADTLLNLSREQQPLSEQTAQLLGALFPGATDDRADNNTAPDWQKIAVATACRQKLTVITGGPGTGKTTTVTKLLLLLLAVEPELRIRMVAPTGKAAARLSESIKASKQRLGSSLDPAVISPEQVAALPEDAATLHRLLGVIPGSHKFRHHGDNPLELDLLLIDEASMVDLPMMHRLLDALPPKARLILLGDQDQLASVEAGAVLADICQGISQGSRVSREQAAILAQLTGYPFSPTENAGLGDNLCRLWHSHRFSGDAGIGRLAKAVNEGDNQAVTQVWQQGYRELSWLGHDAGKGLEQLLQLAVSRYGDYLEAMVRGESADAIIAQYNRFRVLCAMRAGDFGVEGINRLLTARLARERLIVPNQEFYAGRPIIIGSNDYGLGLFNGDIGIILPQGPDKRLLACFVQSDGSLLKVLPARLPSHESCFAMTVHKSQGSEFEQVALVLPPDPSPGQQQLISRELVYTAITRAKDAFCCLGTEALFAAAVARPTRRASGLAARLWGS